MTPKQVKTTKDPSVAWAEHLWDELASNLLNAQRNIIEIIEAKAWEPLGYESFSKAWIDKIMSHVTISSELRPHVVYQMFNEGLTPNQVADNVKGVTPESAKRLKQQKDVGVPPDQATTIVRQHRRKLPGDWGFLHLKVDTQTLKNWDRIAKENDGTVKEFALEAVTEFFNELG